MKALLAIYSHIEAYPPALNAINHLGNKFSEITVVQRNVMVSDWQYPSNVETVNSGPFISYKDVSKLGAVKKLLLFAQFCLLFRRKLISEKPEWIILHDPIPMLAWHIIKFTIRRRFHLWYHNHDVIQGNESFLSRWAFIAQNALFQSIEIFSLPSNDRLKYFPMDRFNGKYFFVPNVPDRALYDQFYKPHPLGNPVRLIYQGYIGAGHGFEQLLLILAETAKGNFLDMRLILKGFRDEKYLNTLMQLAEDLKVRNFVELYPVSSYRGVPEVAANCDIGIGIHMKKDIMSSTLGTASNKIYEYAALGLPVILYDNEQFRKHLGKFEWTFFSDASVENLKETILKIVNDYEHASSAARIQFENELNFNLFFLEPLKAL
jgi:glycosyltransferase involved in cell wall biosynthesis